MRLKRSDNLRRQLKLCVIISMFFLIRVSFINKEYGVLDLSYSKNTIRKEKIIEPEDVKEDEVIISYEGELTGYGPDCKNCLGKVACDPWPYVTNGNIYYNDDLEYDNLRIVAAGRDVPCGSIIELSGSIIDEINNKKPILAIVLDRGSAIIDNKIDLLFESEANALFVGRKKIAVKLIRDGWSK